MTYENRVPINYAFGALTGAAAISDTTLTSTDFATGMSTGLSTSTYVPMTLQDPATKVYEIVWVTAHTGGASTVTVIRGREGTTARAWGSGTQWTVAPTLRDMVLPVATRAALPTDPHVGMRAYIQDEQVAVEYVLNVGWLSQSGMSYRATQLLGADAASVNFTAIPSTLKKINIAWTARSTGAAIMCEIRMRINGDSSTNYNTSVHNQVGTTITPVVNVSLAYGIVGAITGASAAANNFGSGEIVIPGWDSPHPNLNWTHHSHLWESNVNSCYAQGGGLYFAAGPNTSVLLLPELGNFKSGSEFTIYGWG